MKTEEQKSAFILRVEEMVKEIETLMQEGGGNERSCILLVNEKPQDSDMTAQCIAIMGSGKKANRKHGHIHRTAQHGRSRVSRCKTRRS